MIQASSTIRWRNFKTASSLWKRNKCFPSTYAGGIWKRLLCENTSNVFRPDTPEIFENVASLIPTSDLPSRLMRQENGTFSKTLQTGGISGRLCILMWTKTFALALYGTTGGTCSARFFRPVMICTRSFAFLGQIFVLRTFAPKISHIQIFLKLWLQVENEKIILKT